MFVILMVVIMLGLATLATIMITQGMNDPELQEHLRGLEQHEG